MADLDYSDPCALAAALRQARVDLAIGKKVSRVSYTTAQGAQRSVEFAAIDINNLNAEIREAEAACTALSQSNTTPTRFAIGTTFRNRCRGY